MRHVLIILLAALLTTCGVRPTLLEEVRALGELRVVTRNSPITYFIGQAGPEGPDYELVRGFADHLGVKLKLVEADRFGDLLARGGVRPGPPGRRRSHRDRRALPGAWTSARPTSRSARTSSITGAAPRPAPPPTWSGKRIEVVAQSSYVETLTAARGQVPDLAWTEDPTADAGELLDRVAQGKADYTARGLEPVRDLPALSPGAARRLQHDEGRCAGLGLPAARRPQPDRRGRRLPGGDPRLGPAGPGDGPVLRPQGDLRLRRHAEIHAGLPAAAAPLPPGLRSGRQAGRTWTGASSLPSAIRKATGTRRPSRPRAPRAS